MFNMASVIEQIYGKMSLVSIKEEKERNFKLAYKQDLAQSLLRYMKYEGVWGSGVIAPRNLNPETRPRRPSASRPNRA